ncbi:MAG: hypothetical protein PHS62_00995 [Patescibacteria group bacterium]|nr:hypothetical protein [Patescibacteria group bacterium]
MKLFIHNFLQELFYALTGAILIFTFLEIISPGMVLAYFNLNYLLLFWPIIGIIVVL